MDKVSVITPNFNCARFLARTIESVIAQTYKNWEMIIVDDGSTDNSLEIIKKYQQQDPRISFYQMDGNQGPAKARNLAIEKASGRFIAFLDSDDLWHPEKLEAQIFFMQDKKVALSFTFYQLMNEKGEHLNKTIESPLELSYHRLLMSNRIGCLTAIYDTQKLGKVFMPDIRKRQDYGLWLKILRQGITAYGLARTLASYRVREASVSSSKFGLLSYNWELFRRVEGLSVWRSFFYLISNIIFKILK